MHQAAIEWTITPENWSGSVEVVTAIDGRVNNGGVAQAAARGLLPGPGLPADVRPRDHRPEDATRQSNIYIAEAARTGSSMTARRSTSPATSTRRGTTYSRCWFDVRQGRDPGGEDGRLLHLARSRDQRAARSAGRSVQRYPSFDKAFEGHGRRTSWRTCDLTAGPGAGPARTALPHLARPPAGLLTPHGPPRRGRSRARAER